MRALGIMVGMALVPILAAADDKDAKPVTPDAAAKKVNEKCTVEMVVKSTGKGSGVYLNSKEDYKAADNFTIFINKEVVEKLMEAKIDDPAAYYKNKTVRVTGIVKLFRDKPQMIVDKADQIQVVGKK